MTLAGIKLQLMRSDIDRDIKRRWQIKELIVISVLMFRYNELDCKPGYVESDHLSRSYVAIKLKRPTWNAAGNCIIPQVPLGNHIWSCFGWGLQSLLCYHSSGELLPRLSTLTIRIWRFISVALAWELPPPDVIRHPAL